MVTAWVEGSQGMGEPVRRALRRAAVDTVDDGCCPVVLALSRVNAAAVARVVDLRGAGDRRVLVVHGATPAPRGSNVWRLLAAGADEVVGWGDTATDQVVARLERWSEIDRLMDSEEVRSTVVGQSPQLRTVLRRVVEVARFTSSSLLVTGESGTGKEVLAELVHRLDNRPGKPPRPVVLDCSRLVEGLSGSEFFGHELGAFTGAVATREGAFALADGGTLFLDEVGELDPRMQAELLRVVQEHTFKRLGSDIWRRTRFRLVCATHRDLYAEQLAGSFRDDLYHRLTATQVHLPPLRERREDILPLYRHLAAGLGRDPAPALDPVVESMLVSRPYPGNVRELAQVTERLLSRHVGVGPITAGDVAPEDRPEASPVVVSPARRTDDAGPLFGAGGRDALRACVGGLIEAGTSLEGIKRSAAALAVEVAMEMADGELTGAADLLHVSRRALEHRRAAAKDPRAPSAAGRSAR